VKLGKQMLYKVFSDYVMACSMDHVAHIQGGPKK